MPRGVDPLLRQEASHIAHKTLSTSIFSRRLGTRSHERFPLSRTEQDSLLVLLTLGLAIRVIDGVASGCSRSATFSFQVYLDGQERCENSHGQWL